MAEAVRVPRKARAKSRPKVGVGRGRGGGRGDPQGCRSTLPGPGGPRPSGGSVTAAFRLWRFRAPWDFGHGIRLLFVTLVVFFFSLVSFCFKAAGRVAALGGVYVHPLLLEAVRLGAGVGTLF